MPIEASVSLKSGTAPSVGRERIRLLQAVAREGSITAGAKAVGLTYKAAWDAIDAMANLFGEPLLATKSGGAAGGGADADAGRPSRSSRRSAAWRPKWRASCAGSNPTSPAATSAPLESRVRVPHEAPAPAMRYAGVVTPSKRTALSAEVAVAVAAGHDALCLGDAARACANSGCASGATAIVLIKAPFVMVALDEGGPKTSARNCIRRRRRSLRDRPR